MKQRVRIGACTGPADAALVRSVFAAHDIHVVIGSENHAGMLGGLGGAFVPLDVFVHERDVEDGLELLRDIREGGHEAGDVEAESAASEPDIDARADADGVWAHQADEDEGEPRGRVPIDVLTNRRKRVAIAMFLACCVTLGTAHMFAGAWIRGVILLCVEVLGFSYFGTNDSLAGPLIIGAVLYDAIGSIWRIWSSSEPPIPTARATEVSAPRDGE